jgi:rSAM/selenodomain-associated transferase 1
MSDIRCILLFVKSPAGGTVKSRLSRAIDEETAVTLYRNFVLDLLDTLKTGGYALRICFYPPDAGAAVSHWLGKDYVYMPQRGKDLGERMMNAFTDAFSEGFSRALLIGSDLPDLTNAVIQEAFASGGNDAVIGPAFDGGYYLIGFKNTTFLPEIFEGISWGTANVYERTMEIFQRHNYKVHVLPGWRDVDRPEDLRALVERNMDTEFAESRTMVFLLSHAELFFKEKFPHSEK